jgi:hypothetical protein
MLRADWTGSMHPRRPKAKDDRGDATSALPGRPGRPAYDRTRRPRETTPDGGKIDTFDCRLHRRGMRRGCWRCSLATKRFHN